MGIAGNSPQVRYSAAYPTDAPEKLCFGGKPHEVRPKGPQGAARERIEDFSPNLFWDADPADLDFSKHMKRSLDPVSFSFIVNLSGQPKESFRCYTLKQSSQAPWIY